MVFIIIIITVLNVYSNVQIAYFKGNKYYVNGVVAEREEYMEN